jgi:hypothetical protein
LISRLFAWTVWGKGVHGVIAPRTTKIHLRNKSFCGVKKLAVFENAISVHFLQFFILYFFFPSPSLFSYHQICHGNPFDPFDTNYV